MVDRVERGDHCVVSPTPSREPASPKTTLASLTKSRYVDGRQCLRRLWLAVHAPGLATPVDAGLQGLFEQGAEVGRVARSLFPGGELVEAAGDRAAALERTRALLAAADVPAIFEAAFEHGGVHVRVDALERLGGPADGFGLREVKQSTRVKSDYLDDVAVQRWVLEGAGLDVRSVQLVHLSRGFELPESGALDPGALFERADLDARLEASAAWSAKCIAREVAEQHAVLAAGEAPDEEPSRKRCRAGGSDCRFWAHCTEGRPAAFFIEGMRAKKERKARFRRAAETGERWVSPRLGADLAGTHPPIWYLDFEAVGPAIPVFPGTRPHQQVAFQYSLHHVAADGKLSHSEFLAAGDVDPRPETAAALVEALAGDEAPIAAYSPYEKRMLNDMADTCPALADGLRSIRDRLVDLLPIVQNNVYDPAFGGSFSIKSVGPALTPDVTYGDLDDIANGTAAALAFARIAAGELRGDAAEQVRRALLVYCERDTYALMCLHQALLEMA
jgi:hypothetical protein